jgi:hypothetical protein
MIRKKNFQNSMMLTCSGIAGGVLGMGHGCKRLVVVDDERHLAAQVGSSLVLGEGCVKRKLVQRGDGDFLAWLWM